MIKGITPMVLRGVRDELDKSQTRGGRITEKLHQAFAENAEMMQELRDKVSQLREGRAQGAGGPVVVDPDQEIQADVPEEEVIQNFGGLKFHIRKWRRVKATLLFPNYNVWMLLLHWFIKSKLLWCPPLQMMTLENVDFISRGGESLGEIKAIIKKITEKAEQQRLLVGAPLVQSIDWMWRACKGGMGVKEKKGVGRRGIWRR